MECLWWMLAQQLPQHSSFRPFSMQLADHLDAPLVISRLDAELARAIRTCAIASVSKWTPLLELADAQRQHLPRAYAAALNCAVRAMVKSCGSGGTRSAQLFVGQEAFRRLSMETVASLLLSSVATVRAAAAAMPQPPNSQAAKDASAGALLENLASRDATLVAVQRAPSAGSFVVGCNAHLSTACCCG